MLTYFPNFFSKVNLWNRTRGRAEKLREELIKLFPGLSIEVIDRANECVNDADVVVTATNSSVALFGTSDLRKPFVHINGINAKRYHEHLTLVFFFLLISKSYWRRHKSSY